MKVINKQKIVNIVIALVSAIIICGGLYYIYAKNKINYLPQNHSIELNDSCYENFNDIVEDVKLKEKWSRKENNAIYYNAKDDIGFILPKEMFDYVKVYRCELEDGNSVDYDFFYVDDPKKKLMSLEYMFLVNIRPKDEVFRGDNDGNKPYKPVMIRGDKAYYAGTESWNPTFDGNEEHLNRYANFFKLDYDNRFFTSKDFKSKNK